MYEFINVYIINYITFIHIKSILYILLIHTQSNTIHTTPYLALNSFFDTVSFGSCEKFEIKRSAFSTNDKIVSEFRPLFLKPAFFPEAVELLRKDW